MAKLLPRGPCVSRQQTFPYMVSKRTKTYPANAPNLLSLIILRKTCIRFRDFPERSWWPLAASASAQVRVFWWLPTSCMWNQVALSPGARVVSARAGWQGIYLVGCCVQWGSGGGRHAHLEVVATGRLPWLQNSAVELASCQCPCHVAYK